MQARVFPSSEASATIDLEVPAEPVRWGLLYAVEDFKTERLRVEITKKYPGITLVGATSFRGVFSGRKLVRGAALLLGGESDGLTAASTLRSVGPERARAEATAAAREVTAALGKPPELVILHATPGFEEAVISGIVEALGPSVEIYGGSAADDTVAGRWSVFNEKGTTGRGFAMAGLSTTSNDVSFHGGFISGYLPTAKRGVVTRAKGRVIAQIDGEPAASVYDRWTGGIISGSLRRGGSVLLQTNLHPLAREIQSRSAVPHRLLSHPHAVHADGGLELFTDVEAGDVVELMIGTPEPLVTRAAKVVPRTLGRTSGKVAGGLLVYCGGCLAAVMDRADDIASTFEAAIDQAPFVGVATFGEQGCFVGGRDKINRHGNLMCSSVLFVRR
ncbi:MAG TPA: FIST N-terminal domain-containing protein [Polyangiaceae bacterium]|nr:FIST N-terminal domain-containing protein [Polyangiaceae bacterium]